MKTSVVTARLEEEELVQLDELASHLDRPRSWIIAKAIKAYLEEERAFLAFIQKGEDAIERGDTLSQAEMEDWFTARYAADAA